MALGEAIRHAIKGRATQQVVADRLGVSQPAISGWIHGTGRPTFEQLAALEDACDRPRGFVLRAAGLVQDAHDVRSAIRADPALDEAGREWLLITYASALEVARKHRE